MSNLPVASQQSYIDAFSSFLVNVSHSGPWWYGITLPETEKHSLAEECGMTKEEFSLLLFKCGLTGNFPRYTLKASKFEMFLHAAGLGYGTSDSAEVVKASYTVQPKCQFLRLGAFRDQKPWPPLDILKRDKPNITNIVELRRILHSTCYLLNKNNTNQTECPATPSVPTEPQRMIVGSPVERREEEKKKRSRLFH
jgi:hypothetical protein